MILKACTIFLVSPTQGWQPCLIQIFLYFSLKEKTSPNISDAAMVLFLQPHASTICCLNIIR